MLPVESVSEIPQISLEEVEILTSYFKRFVLVQIDPASIEWIPKVIETSQDLFNACILAFETWKSTQVEPENLEQIISIYSSYIELELADFPTLEIGDQLSDSRGLSLLEELIEVKHIFEKLGFDFPEIPEAVSDELSFSAQSVISWADKLIYTLLWTDFDPSSLSEETLSQLQALQHNIGLLFEEDEASEV